MNTLPSLQDTTPTRPSLLIRLRNSQDHQAWHLFVELYGGIVYQFARRQGLQDADAADLTQEVLQEVSRAFAGWQYDRSRGTFRGWLRCVTRRKIGLFLRRLKGQPVGTGDTGIHRRLQEEQAPDEEEAAWEAEYRQHLFRLAADQVRQLVAPRTWQAFWKTAVEGADPVEVAAHLKLTVGAVYVARSRVQARLALLVQELAVE
jgi:RNA polymerase sigma-70 factor (ECF subfamily)